MRASPVSWLATLRVVLGFVLGVAALSPPGCNRSNSGSAADEEALEEAGDPAEVTVGERLFLETRFAQFFFARSGGNVNGALPAGDPIVDAVETTGEPLDGPFQGKSINCRQCHLVDELRDAPGGGVRTYADFTRRSPVPERTDGKTVTARNSPALVNSTLPRDTGFLLHFDGEFASVEDLVRGTLTGRNFGWLPGEQADAAEHIARVLREDNGKGDLAHDFGGLSYAVTLRGTSGAIPSSLRLPARFRLDVRNATTDEILDSVAALIGAYVRSLLFQRDLAGEFSGSPYDLFLKRNHLPRTPDPGETPLAYGRRLRALLAGLPSPRLVTAADGELALHSQDFVFGQGELDGLGIFLAEPDSLPLSQAAIDAGGIGNCVACHTPPAFTDFLFHNTGETQDEYDSIHGAGAFAALSIPNLATRDADFDAFLPPTAAHPNAVGPFLGVPSSGVPGLTDLGLWNVFANDDVPAPQQTLRTLLTAELGLPSSPTEDDLLPFTIAMFKTPGLRDLGQSAPYFHTGRKDRITDVVRFYAQSSTLARAGDLRNASPPLSGIALTEPDVAPLAAFLRALNEDYE